MAVGDLITQDYEMEFAGLLMGGDTVYGIVQIDGLLDIPKVSTGDRERLRRHGLMPGDDWLQGRAVSVAVEIYDPTDTAIAAFTEATAPGGDEVMLAFQFPGVAGGEKAGIFCRPRRRKLVMDEEFYYGFPEAVVEWQATDPRIYSVVENNEVAGLPSGSPGAAFNMTFDLGFGGVSETGNLTITNDGNFATPWRAVIDGPVTNPSIENVDTGETISVTLVVGSGDELVIDSETRTIMLNGTASRYSSLDAGSNWWDMAPGNNTIKFRAATFTASTLTLTWRDAWI